jgi:hypothetical protein
MRIKAIWVGMVLGALGGIGCDFNPCFVLEPKPAVEDTKLCAPSVNFRECMHRLGYREREAPCAAPEE